MRAISLFANVGIAELFLKQVGVEVKIANEIDPIRSRFYSEIYPETKMIIGDFTDKKINEVLINLSKDEMIDTVIATPPCQGMSEAGKRNEFDDRNQLIIETINFIEKLKPRYIFIENVPVAVKTKIKVDKQIILIPDFIRKRLQENYNINN